VSIKSMAVVLVLTALAGSGCDPTKASPEPTPMQTVTTHVTIYEGDAAGDISPPARLDVIMIREGTVALRCDMMGGDLVMYPSVLDEPEIWVCEDVDY